MNTSLLAVGLGHPDRGDDAAGHVAVGAASIGRRVLRRDCSDLIELIEGETDVVIVDAMRSGSVRGTVRRFTFPAEQLPLKGFVSSHFFGLSETLTLANTLGKLPSEITVFGIEVGTTALGDRMSEEVIAAARDVARTIDGMGAS